MIPTREEALALLKEYNSDPFHIQHALTVAGVMRYFAKELGYGAEEDFWSVVGLLHDPDFEQYPEQHCIREQEIMLERALDERIISATASHGYKLAVDIAPEHEMEKVLYATDELTGFIGAVALLRPSKSVSDLELKSVKKKYKSANFAVYSNGQARYYEHLRIENGCHGTGDVYACAFVGDLLSGKETYAAAIIAAVFTVSSIKKTVCDSTHWYGVKFEQALPKLIAALGAAE